MPDEFSQLNGLDQWRAKFDELMAVARNAAANDDIDPRIAISARLTEFTIMNPTGLPGSDEEAEYRAMDDAAQEAADAVLMDAVATRVQRIAARTSEVAGLRKNIESQTRSNTAAASSIRLDKAKRVIDTTTQLVSSLQDLRRDIIDAAEDSSDADLSKRIETAIRSVQKLRQEIEAVL